MGFFFGIFLVFLMTSTPASAFGLGLVVGQPTGISFKSNVNEANAVDGAISWSMGEEHTDLSLTGDYLWHHGPHVYYGLGMRVRTSSDDEGAGKGGGAGGKKGDDAKGKGKKKLAVQQAQLESDVDVAPRIPLGVRYFFGSPAVEVFGEVAGLIGIDPEFDLDVGFALGARYFF